MNKFALPAHLQEIIDKGYRLYGADTPIQASGGIFNIEAHSDQLKSGVGSDSQVQTKKVAYCFDGPFLPVRNGASYTLFNLMNSLGKSEEVVPVLVLCYRGDPLERYYNQNFKTIFVTPEHYYNHGDLTEAIFTKNNISVVQFCSSEGLLNLGPFVQRLGLKVIFDVQNVDYILEERLGHDERAVTNAKQLQIDAISYSNYILCRSEIDQRQLINLGAKQDALVIYNGGIDVGSFKFRTDAPHTRKLVFLAHMYYEPNENAFAYIMKEIMPKLDGRYTITVIGNTPDALMKEYKQNKTVVFKQGIDDLSDELRGYDIALAPIFEASGTRLKVLDYLAVGVPVVTTNLALEGLVGDIEAVVSVANTVNEMVWAVKRIANDPERFMNRSEKGRQYVEKYYDWESQLEPFLIAYGVHPALSINLQLPY